MISYSEFGEFEIADKDLLECVAAAGGVLDRDGAVQQGSTDVICRNILCLNNECGNFRCYKINPVCY